MKLKKSLIAFALAVPMISNAAQVIYFQDNNSYSFAGFTISNVIGGVTHTNAQSEFFNLTSEIPVNTLVTLNFTVSNYSSNSNGVFFYLSPVNGFAGYSDVTDGNMPFTNGLITIQLTPTQVSRFASFGPQSWSQFDSVTISNILIFSVIDPSAPDTITSFGLNAAALRNTLNLQSAKTAQGLTYDCTVFDANNICVSFAGTRSNGDNGFDATTGALIIAHRPTANIRFGAYVDQNIGTTDSNGLKVKRSSPGYGLFGVWSQRNDGLGTEVRASANSGKVDIETTRLAVGTAEAGFGVSNIKSSGVQLEVSQGYAVNNQWVVRPYVGYRQMTNKRGAYTESATVDFPLTYAGLKQTTESILAGVRFVGKLTPQTSLTLSAGMERDVKSSVDDYKATEATIGDLSLSMSENKKKSRPTASLGVVHSIDKTQTIGLSVVHRKEALQSGNTTTGMLQYSVGF
jgi:hypothetical protein